MGFSQGAGMAALLAAMVSFLLEDVRLLRRLFVGREARYSSQLPR